MTPPTSSATTRPRPASLRSAGFRKKGFCASTSSRTAGSLMRGYSPCCADTNRAIGESPPAPCRERPPGAGSVTPPGPPASPAQAVAFKPGAGYAEPGDFRNLVRHEVAGRSTLQKMESKCPARPRPPRALLATGRCEAGGKAQRSVPNHTGTPGPGEGWHGERE